MNTFRHATAFISSTFADMADERNLMAYNVLPRIKKWAFDRGIIFDVIDLRWGINDEQANDLHHTIKLCLQNVKDSEPIFICFLGERYGWIPPLEDFNQSMFEKNIDKYKNLSATELEIVEALEGAILDSTPKSCLFLMREPLDFDGIPQDVAKIYKDEDNANLLGNLKNSIYTRDGIAKHDYYAKFSHENLTYSLEDFMCDRTPLEDIIFEELKKILIDKYGVSDNDVSIFDDVLTRQRFHQKELLRYPKDTQLQNKLNEYLDTTPDYSYTPIGTPHSGAIFSQISHFIEEQSKDKKQDVIYRYWGLNVQIDSINDLICSIAYEFSNDKQYINHPIESLLYIKNHLERTTQKTVLMVVGIPCELMRDLLNIATGLKWTKMLIFYDISDHTPDDLRIDYDENSFKTLAKFMFERKAKSLTDRQLDKVLQASNKDYSTLKLIVEYLCNFAQYETLDFTINSISSLDDFGLTRRYLNSIMATQNSHVVKNVMGDVIELLCNSPLSLSKDDIVDAICLARNITSQIEKKQIDKEVAFSLRLASVLIDEYNSRFKINDEIIKTLIMFKEDTSKEPPHNYIPIQSALILALRWVYLNRLKDESADFDKYDAQNLLEIIKDYWDEHLDLYLLVSILGNTKVFYKLAKALGKKHLVDFFKTLTMQSMGYGVDSYFAKEINRVIDIENDRLAHSGSYANAIMQGKLFSLAKTLHKDNYYMRHYLAVQKLNEDALASFDTFERELNNALADKAGCHKIVLPSFLEISKGNSCAYTIFDPSLKEYANYYCVCQDGFLIILDVWSGEMVSTYAIPRDLGKIVCVFYQEHTLHIVFEKGGLCLLQLWSKQANTYRILPENIPINTFEHYYSNGCQVAVADDRRIVLFKGARVVNDITFAPNLRVLSAYGLNADKGEFTKVCLIARDEYGYDCLYSVDMENHKIIDQSIFTKNQVVSTIQDEVSNDVYILFDNDTSCVIKFNEDGTFYVCEAQDKCMFSLQGKHEITQDGDKIKYNGNKIANGHIKCCFSSRSILCVVCDGNILYCIDNGY